MSQLANRLGTSRQKQMLRLMERYALLVRDPNSWILPHCFYIGYLDLADPNLQLQYQDFFCNTNNIVFAAMIFEAQMLPVKITIGSIEYKSLVTLL